MILQLQDDFDKVIMLDRQSNRYHILSKKEQPELAATPMSGGCSVVNGVLACLYRIKGALYFRLGEREFEVTDNMKSTMAEVGNCRVFQLILDANPLVNLRYPFPGREVPFEIDPTPFMEDEDFDFLLFVHNVLERPGRRQGVYSE